MFTETPESHYMEGQYVFPPRLLHQYEPEYHLVDHLVLTHRGILLEPSSLDPPWLRHHPRLYESYTLLFPLCLSRAI